MTEQLHTIVHIGAGNGSQLPDYLSLNPSRIVLIEPLPSQAEHLRQASTNNKNVEVWELAISAEHHNGTATFIEFNLADASSLHSASGLLNLYPGIKVTQQHQVSTITPAELITRLQLPANSSHHLIIEANGEETAIIKALAKHQWLAQFANIALTLANTALYKGEYDLQAVQQLLQNHHFELIKGHSDDPDVSIFIWQHNPLKQYITELSQQLANSQATSVEQQNTAKSQLAEHKSVQEKLNAKLTEQDAQLTQLKKQLTAAQSLCKEQSQQQQKTEQQLSAAQEKVTNTEQTLKATKDELANTTSTLLSTEEELKKHKGYFANRKQQHEAAELRIIELTQTLAKNVEQLTTLKQQLDTQQHSQQTLTALEQKMEQLFHSQAEQLTQNTNALGQHVTKMHSNSQRHLQSTMAVQHSLHHGALPLQFNDASINTELAQYLIEKIQRTNYDLIIEFGSGTSTLLLAKALSNKIRGVNNLNNGTSSPAISYQPANELSEYISPNHNDLPQRIISFEHNKRYYQDIQQRLQQDKLELLVDLQLAPLVDVQGQEGSLFYDCSDKLKQLAQLLNGRDAHILILVDGPSSDQENPLARYPALPCVLNCLSAHRLDVVLDDYHRAGEQSVAEQWRALVAKRDLTISEQQLGHEKHALLLSINQ